MARDYRNGLKQAEVEESRRKHGDNLLTPPEKEPVWKQFLEKFEAPIIRILLIALLLSIGVSLYQLIAGTAGWSAGSNVACPTLCTTNDMPIVQPASFNCLNLVPFQINPHYLDPHPEIDKMIKHGGETRQDRINEYLAVNQDRVVVGLREATALWVTDGQMMLKGGKKMLVMRYGKEAVEIDPNSDVTFLLDTVC